MESVPKIALTILEELWGCTIDLEDAYFHLPICWFFQKFLAFRLDGVTYVFQYLPFGLSVAPWAFTRIIKPIKAYLHRLKFRINSFLDDFFLLARTPLLLQKMTVIVLALFKKLGLSVNHKKSKLAPSQKVEYLGVIFHLKTQQLSLPEEKVVQISNLCQEVQHLPLYSRRQLESLLGLLSFAAPLVPLGRLNLRDLILWMNTHTSTVSRDLKVCLTKIFKRDLLVWQDLDFLRSPVAMALPAPSLQLMTDASGKGWAGVILPHKAWGAWSEEDLSLSINWRELRAVYLSLRDFLPLVKGKSVSILSDNQTAIACIMNEGTQKSASLLEMTRTLLEFALLNSIVLVPKHLPGKLNTLADMGSRREPMATEWSLDRRTFNWLSERNGLPQVDLFANRLNRQVKSFISPFPDNLAIGTNALSVDWNQWDNIYLFPPVNLLVRVMTCLSSYRGKGILIAPDFPQALWFPQLLERSKGQCSLPGFHSLYQETFSGRVFHPNPSIYRLQEWKL